MDQQRLDKLKELLRACPHGEGCEQSCPMQRIRDTPSPEGTLSILLGHEQADLLQTYSLCARERRKRENDSRGTSVIAE